MTAVEQSKDIATCAGDGCDRQIWLHGTGKERPEGLYRNSGRGMCPRCYERTRRAVPSENWLGANLGKPCKGCGAVLVKKSEWRAMNQLERKTSGKRAHRAHGKCVVCYVSHLRKDQAARRVPELAPGYVPAFIQQRRARGVAETGSRTLKLAGTTRTRHLGG